MQNGSPPSLRRRGCQSTTGSGQSSEWLEGRSRTTLAGHAGSGRESEHVPSGDPHRLSPRPTARPPAVRSRCMCSREERSAGRNVVAVSWDRKITLFALVPVSKVSAGRWERVMNKLAPDMVRIRPRSLSSHMARFSSITTDRSDFIDIYMNALKCKHLASSGPQNRLCPWSCSPPYYDLTSIGSGLDMGTCEHTG